MVFEKFPENAKQFLIKYQDSNVSNFVIRKNPIQSGVEKFLNFLSAGKYEEVKKNLDYDKMFHLRLDFEIDGRNYMTEKTANVQFRNAVTNEDDVVMRVNNNKEIKLLDFVNNTIKSMGEKNYFDYDAFNNNCQNYIMSCLSSNGLLNSELKAFIYQDVQEMIEKIPKYVKVIAKFATKAGSVVDKGLQKLGFRGLKRGGRVRRFGRIG